MNKILIAIIVLAALGGGLWYMGGNRIAPYTPPREVPAPGETPEGTVKSFNASEWEYIPDAMIITITYTDAGFSPAAVTVKKGTTVAFKNESSADTWPASAMHPNHTGYPGSDIKNCGAATDMFDSCRGLKPGESWSFTFSEVGKWGYHDHLHARQFGSVTVEE